MKQGRLSGVHLQAPSTPSLRFQPGDRQDRKMMDFPELPTPPAIGEVLKV